MLSPSSLGKPRAPGLCALFQAWQPQLGALGVGGGGKDAQAGGRREREVDWEMDRQASVTPCENSLGRRESSVVKFIASEDQ